MGLGSPLQFLLVITIIKYRRDPALWKSVITDISHGIIMMITTSTQNENNTSYGKRSEKCHFWTTYSPISYWKYVLSAASLAVLLISGRLIADC